MDSQTDLTEVKRSTSSSDFDNNLASALPVLFEEGKWQVRSMDIRPGKAEALWAVVSKFKTLFSDMSLNSYGTFVQAITDTDSVWYEICEGDQLAALIFLQGMSKLVDIEVHILALDRMPAEKAPVVKQLIRYVFKTYPMLHRMTTQPLTIYYAAIRLAKRVGFVEEGVKREAVLVHSKWADQAILGLLRRQGEG